jgi:hypothetical protein
MLFSSPIFTIFLDFAFIIASCVLRISLLPFQSSRVVHWEQDKPKLCPKCHHIVIHKYVGSRRILRCLDGLHAVKYRYYSCTNPRCPLRKGFHLKYDAVIKYKQFGKDVWEMVVKDYVEGKHNATTEAANLMRHHPKLHISQRSVLRIWETYLSLSSTVSDQKTRKLIKKQGYILLALDGQRPEAGRKSLWYFLDVVSDRVLHIAYLDAADTSTLKRVLTQIRVKYGVKIKGVVSDHQSSIVKAIKEALPKAKHQACHFHFLKNLWRSLEAIDRHLQKTLETAVSCLYLNRVNSKRKATGRGTRGESIRMFFQPIMDDLKRGVSQPRCAFDKWGGVVAFEKVTEAIGKFEELLPKAVQPWEKSMITKAISSLTHALEDTRSYYSRLQFLIPRFNQIRAILGDPDPEINKMKAAGKKWTASQKKYLRRHHADQPDDQRKIKNLTYRASAEAVLDQWICFYRSHEANLFTFCEVPGLPRTNVGMEQDFSHENRFFRVHYGQIKVGYNVRVYGGQVLKLLKSYDSEQIMAIFNEYETVSWQQELKRITDCRQKERKPRMTSKTEDHWPGFRQVSDRLQQGVVI